ncbi:MAG TPA: hypothetical protein VE861_05560 [Gemmatimonadaceae bacterium]|nr:hypothetical protein [Gemmatimonadaceae bacterium]
MPAHITRFTARVAMIAAIASSAAFTTVFGPPHITVRKVAAADNAPAGAVLLVEGKHHDQTEALNVVGRAEGRLNGRRVSQVLRIVKQSAGHFSVAKQWQDGSPWVVVLTAELGPNGEHAVAEALVQVDARGAISSIEYPAPGWVDRSDTPKRTSSASIDALLARLLAQR